MEMGIMGIRSKMPAIIRLGKTLKRYLNGILETIKSGINSAVTGGLRLPSEC
ncbi:hypothetical protein ACNF40_05920 [Cuniculiplasma sp. SKW4]|uniref:hypothetical protein n=1 Tax=Cuniculiplasma sp. SKW4 TaxID=3400171 RepID=UPI003FD23195